MSAAQLLGGPPPASGMEPLASHLARLGPLPGTGADIIDTLERSGLRGRGGASFPVGRKWRTVAAAGRQAVVLVNGAEGEPLSRKDALLMTSRPHLVLDGAVLAARAVGARHVVLSLHSGRPAAVESVRVALAERSDPELRGCRLVASPPRYIAGEETAAVHFVNAGVALPTSVPPRPFERGVGGRPTLVQNVESLAQVALIARHGAESFHAAGRAPASGTLLATVSGAVAAPGVVEVPGGTSIAEAIGAAGGVTTPVSAVILGGYFGGWIAAHQAWDLQLDAEILRARGQSLGCGIVHALDAGSCGVAATSSVLTYLAGESARQCGPCVFGLGAIAGALQRIAGSVGEPQDLDRLARWAAITPGRGACRHPDGAAGFLRSALTVFAEDLDAHHRLQRCSVRPRAAVA